MGDAIADAALVRGHLIDAARERTALSYSTLLGMLGHRFTRPKMRALCATLTRIDAGGADAGEPGLAVLVVREGDGLPGQGWWAGGRALALGHEGDWTGPDARRLVDRLQREAFAYWAGSAAAQRAADDPALPAVRRSRPRG